MAVWEEIVDYTVPSNTTSVDFTGLNITKDDFIKIHTTIINPTSSSCHIRLFANNENSTTDYYTQRLTGGNSTIGASRFNTQSPRVCFVEPNKNVTSFSNLKISENNTYNLFSNYNVNDSNIELTFNYSTSVNLSFSNGINALNFNSSVSNSIGANSRIQIYRLTAEKVADITVSSNTTQVDITGLSIDKGSEYLLVSDIVDTAGTGSTQRLTPNDLTTITDYYHQNIYAGGGSSSAGRANNPDFAYSQNSTNPSLSYTHIKLSNIGAFTYQSYEIRSYGTSNIQLINYFGSSISESFTSINKLNIRARNTNGIGNGSRYQLYKLY